VNYCNIWQILTQSEQLQSKMQQLELAVAQGSLQHVADLASQCRSLLSHLDTLPSLHLMRARIDEATLSTPPSSTPPHMQLSQLLPPRHSSPRRQRLEDGVFPRRR
jgi:hypothetical protein